MDSGTIDVAAWDEGYILTGTSVERVRYCDGDEPWIVRLVYLDGSLSGVVIYWHAAWADRKRHLFPTEREAFEEAERQALKAIEAIDRDVDILHRDRAEAESDLATVRERLNSLQSEPMKDTTRDPAMPYEGGPR